jgi:uncharacterized protein YukE
VSDDLNLVVSGDPAGCRTAGGDLARAATALGSTSSSLSGLVGRAGRAWTGIAADAFVDQLSTTRKDVDELTDRIALLSRALAYFANELDVVRSSMADALATAAAGDLWCAARPCSGPWTKGLRRPTPRRRSAMRKRRRGTPR